MYVNILFIWVCLFVLIVMNANIDLGANMEFCFKWGETSRETHDKPKTVYRNKTLSKKYVKELCKSFREGRNPVEDGAPK